MLWSQEHGFTQERAHGQLLDLGALNLSEILPLEIDVRNGALLGTSRCQLSLRCIGHGSRLRKAAKKPVFWLMPCIPARKLAQLFNMTMVGPDAVLISDAGQFTIMAEAMVACLSRQVAPLPLPWDVILPAVPVEGHEQDMMCAGGTHGDASYDRALCQVERRLLCRLDALVHRISVRYVVLPVCYLSLTMRRVLSRPLVRAYI